MEIGASHGLTGPVIRKTCRRTGASFVDSSAARRRKLGEYVTLGRNDGPKSCAVSFTDLEGTRHTVDVAAESLYEAAILGISALRRDSFLESVPGPATRLEVEIKHPTVRHAVSLQQLKTWLDRGSTNPAEVLRRKRLKSLLEGA